MIVYEILYEEAVSCMHVCQLVVVCVCSVYCVLYSQCVLCVVLKTFGIGDVIHIKTLLKSNNVTKFIQQFPDKVFNRHF